MSANRKNNIAVDTPQFRPELHFTPARNWMNDPNGLVYYEGEYHLFFQYNPEDNVWGHMSWGHAVSHDLVHWTELPIAMPEGEQMIFSGSALVDWQNDSGLGDGISPPLLAFFTAFDRDTLIQSQHLAYSHDRGRTWTHYHGNPLIDLDLENFRDPKVFYHEPSKAWIMVVALAQLHKVQFYRSENLIDWSLASEFGPRGRIGGQWECPDLFQVPVAGKGRSAPCPWVLKVDVDKNCIGEGSGAQYFVGDFDGHGFSIDSAIAPADGELVDYGPDFYAAVTWANLPADHEDPVWIGWMSNHQSGHGYPSHPWRGVQSIPRALSLVEERGMLRLCQRPIRQLSQVSKILRHQIDLEEAGPHTVTLTKGVADIHVNVPRDISGRACFVLADTREPLLSLTVDASDGRAEFIRHACNNANSSSFEQHSSVDLGVQKAFDCQTIQILIDRSTVEIFLDGGRRCISACVFPEGSMTLTAELVSRTATA